MIYHIIEFYTRFTRHTVSADSGIAPQEIINWYINNSHIFLGVNHQTLTFHDALLPNKCSGSAPDQKHYILRYSQNIKWNFLQFSTQHTYALWTTARKTSLNVLFVYTTFYYINAGNATVNECSSGSYIIIKIIVTYYDVYRRSFSKSVLRVFYLGGTYTT